MEGLVGVRGDGRVDRESGMAVAGVVESQECGEGQHRGEGGEVEVVCRLLRYGVSHAV